MEDVKVRVLDVADPKKQESLQAENEPDPMEGEQTWPTEEELAQAEGTLCYCLGPFTLSTCICDCVRTCVCDRMGTMRFRGSIHVAQWQTSKETIANAIAQREGVLIVSWYIQIHQQNMWDTSDMGNYDVRCVVHHILTFCSFSQLIMKPRSNR